MTTDLHCDALIIGAGPGGYAAAIRCAQHGLSTIVVEGAEPGGTCLNVGCIPSKALIEVAHAYDHVRSAADGQNVMGISAGAPTVDMHRAVAWKDELVGQLTGGVRSLLRRSGARLVEGWATIVDGKTVIVRSGGGEMRITTSSLVLATGSRPVELACLPFGGRVISSTDLLSATELPRRLAVVGGGYIGLELGTAMAKLGVAVTVIEAAPRILPTFDPLLTDPVVARLGALGVELRTGCQVEGMDASGEAVLARGSDGMQQRIEADRVLVTVGRAPVTDGWGLELLDLDRDGPFVEIDDRCRTSMAGVYAIGDLTGEPMLAHRATAQAELVADVLAGDGRRWDPACIPSVVYTDPEIVSVGMTRGAAEAAGLDVAAGTFPFTANGRALTTTDAHGLVQVLTDTNGTVLGVHAVGAGVSELSAAFAIAIEMGARAEDVAATIHAHPTRSEALQEAALATSGRALHVPARRRPASSASSSGATQLDAVER